ncbi:MAG: response regulator [Candidatus Aceula meridiana]|nr:response regulator [Candidatus Aceula meridiana]
MGKKKIIIIDDEKAFCELMKEVLQKMGDVEILTAYDGVSGRDLVVEQNPDLVFLDYVMPKMRGESVLRLLKEDPKTKDIPIVIISGSGGATSMPYADIKEFEKLRLDEKGKISYQDRQMVAKTFGAVDFLGKPFSKKDLEEIVHRVLGEF